MASLITATTEAGSSPAPVTDADVLEMLGDLCAALRPRPELHVVQGGAA